MRRERSSARDRVPRRGVVAVVCGVFVAAAALPARGVDGPQDHRNRIGLGLFRTLLAADRDLADKRLESGELLILFFHRDDPDGARELMQAFARSDEGGEPEPVRGLPILLEATNEPEFGAYSERRPAGIFLAQELDDATRDAVVAFGVANGIATYSPFEGDVEAGVLGGLSVQARVRPYVNVRTLRASGMSLKDFFLAHSRLHE
jgi:hypothetical protein